MARTGALSSRGAAIVPAPLSVVRHPCRSQSSLQQPPLRPSQPAGISRGASVKLKAAENGYVGQYPPLQTERFVLELDGASDQLVIETGAIGRQANGAVLAKQGDTVIYTTACCKDEYSVTDFVPLSVDYVEKLSSVGRTAQGYIKRERQKDHEVLTSRLVDRSIRPLFPEGWSKETQILETVMSYDGVHSTEPVAITAAGVALAISDLPFRHAAVGVRVGWIGGKAVLNPSPEQQDESKLDLILAGTVNGLVMIEASASFIKERDLIRALEAGVDYVATVSAKLEEWIATVRKTPMQDGIVQLPEGLQDRIYEFSHDTLKQLFSKTSKKERNTERNALWSKLEEKFIDGSADDDQECFSELFVKQAYKKCESDILRERMLKSGLRIDGRGAADIRPIYSSGNVLPRTHGSALFTRGNTQALCVATLGSQKAAQKVDTIQEDDLRRFYLQYFFPPSSVGEVRRFTLYPGRRELGHGQLASWALAPSVPDVEAFPYTIRLESTITESDGSSSMASVCGGYLAMMDAGQPLPTQPAALRGALGVPMVTPVAGIAMGLMLEENGNFIVLSDIMGTEDALGDMDFKVAGSVDGVSALQMDVKVSGVTFQILTAALEQAHAGRQHILREMRHCHPPPREELSPYAPHIKTIQVDPSVIGMLIGPGGKTIRALEEQSGVNDISVDDDRGEVEIHGSSFATVQKAEELISLSVGDLEVGQVIRDCVVSGVKAFGVFVDLAPGRTGLLHISELSLDPIKDINEVVKMGDRLDVEVISFVRQGKCSVSRKRLLIKQQQPPQPPPLKAKPVIKNPKSTSSTKSLSK